jgi:CRP-like cAMP-binding protein
VRVDPALGSRRDRCGAYCENRRDCPARTHQFVIETDCDLALEPLERVRWPAIASGNRGGSEAEKPVMALSQESAQQRRELLAKGSLFSKLSEHQLDALVQVSRVQKLRARQELFHKGDPGSQVYLIVRGRLKVITTSAQGEDVVFNIMGPGEVFGELALLAGGRRTATITAIDDSELLVLDRREFLPFLKTDPEAAIKLLEVLAERLLRIGELVEDTTFLNLPARLAKKLLSLSRAYGVATSGGTRIDLKLSQAELGDLVATTRESINKQMKTWSDEGLVSMKSGIITIHRIDDLEALAGFAGD